jgi:hypothetical protein
LAVRSDQIDANCFKQEIPPFAIVSPRRSQRRGTAMNEFEIIFADPLTTAAYMYGSAICVAILLGWGAVCLRQQPNAWTPELRAVFARR